MRRSEREEKLLEEIKEILGVVSKGSFLVIWINNSEKYIVFNPETTLEWSGGYLTKVKITGTDESGNPISFYKELTWDAEGNLVKVGKWVKE